MSTMITNSYKGGIMNNNQTKFICWADQEGNIVGQYYNNYYNQNAQVEKLGVITSKYESLFNEFRELEDTANVYHDELEKLGFEFPKTLDELAADQAKLLLEYKKQLEAATANMAEMQAANAMNIATLQATLASVVAKLDIPRDEAIVTVPAIVTTKTKGKS